jgi:integrase
MLYRRGNVWWYEFIFNGSRIRESSHTDSKTIARQLELKRRRDLELAVGGIKRERPLQFRVATKQWFSTKTALSKLGLRYYRQYIRKLEEQFGNRFISEIDADDIAALQRLRQSEGLSGRQINAEVATLRAILRYFGLWGQISGRIRLLRQNNEVGRSLTVEEEERLLHAAMESRSPALYPFLLLSLDAGLRPSETRALLRSSLKTQWEADRLIEADVLVRHSKTAAGAGRLVPLTKRSCAALGPWMERFQSAALETFLFPFHRVAIGGYQRRPLVYDVRPELPMSMSSYKRAFETARKKAGVECRFYDARHTFITRLAENPTVSEETIRQLAGHVNHKMLGRYAHIRVEARRAAIATLERKPLKNGEKDDPPQNPPQSPSEAVQEIVNDVEKTEQDQGLRIGSPGRIRTSDPTVNSRLLYRLSYRGALTRLSESPFVSAPPYEIKRGREIHLRETRDVNQ